MRKQNAKRSIALLLAMALSTSFAGCASTPGTIDSGNDPAAESTVLPSGEQDLNLDSETESVLSQLTDRQKNSFEMLYYLTITAEEIRMSKDNRLVLDDIYSSLLNDINPGAVDDQTQAYLGDVRNTIKDCLDLSVKREHLRYLYNQDKARALHNAVPNPLSMLSATHTVDWKKFAAGAVFTIVDSYMNYKNAKDVADESFLIVGWELDDREIKTLQSSREGAFNYMVDMVQNYELDGNLTLNEKAVQTFAEICTIESAQERAHRLEAEQETYQLLGNYWLKLADCYYELAKYSDCLDCVDRYNTLSTGIYRKDFNYARFLPKVIVAARECYSGDEYITRVSEYADALLANTATEEWSARYFAAQVYLDLYTRTEDPSYCLRQCDHPPGRAEIAEYGLSGRSKGCGAGGTEL